MGGFRAAPWIGDPAAIAERRRFELHRIYWQDTDANLLLLINVTTAFLGLALFLLRRTEREYFWYGAAQLLLDRLQPVGVLADFVGQDYLAAAALSLIGSNAAKCPA